MHDLSTTVGLAAYRSTLLPITPRELLAARLDAQVADLDRQIALIREVLESRLAKRDQLAGDRDAAVRAANLDADCPCGTRPCCGGRRHHADDCDQGPTVDEIIAECEAARNA